jgi:hypothetical protein
MRDRRRERGREREERKEKRETQTQRNKFVCLSLTGVDGARDQRDCEARLLLAVLA